MPRGYHSGHFGLSANVTPASPLRQLTVKWQKHFRVYSARDRTRLKLTLRAKRLGLSLTEAREIIDMYDSPRDTGPQLRKFLAVLADHRRQLEEQMADLVANLDEVKVQEKEARP